MHRQSSGSGDNNGGGNTEEEEGEDCAHGAGVVPGERAHVHVSCKAKTEERTIQHKEV
jgi:hypothetical protein